MTVSMGAAPTSSVCLLCGVGTLVCAFPIDRVVEVMRPLPIERLEDLPPYVLGVAIVRGAPTPVVDAARLLGVAAQGGITRFVTVRSNDRRLSLAVGTVRGIRSLARLELEELPPLLRAIDGRGASAIGAVDADLLLILETARLVPESVWSLFRPGGAAA